MHVLVTGHTGFKGSWLSLLLSQLGHSVSGISIDPKGSSKSSEIDISKFLTIDERVDIRDRAKLSNAVKKIKPDFIFHLAAQPLVRESYRDPRTTFESNFMGTFNLIEVANAVSEPSGIVVVTTDKVYRNTGKSSGYVEGDSLGGSDPYSASKAAADLLAQSMAASLEIAPMAVVRAGNVIGGGDKSQERLIPDLNRAWTSNKEITLRYPSAIRPWQHVLDCLNGYLEVAKHLLATKTDSVWNIGPEPSSTKTVLDIVNHYSKLIGLNFSIVTGPPAQFHEESILTLDSSKANRELNWQNRLNVNDSIEWTAEWNVQHRNGANSDELTLKQIQKFLEFQQ